MDKEAVRDEIKKIIEDFLKSQNIDLVDLIYRYEGRDLVLRILVDRPAGGITIGDCAQLNKEISAILDEKGILEQRYILEVSSPGIDRQLKTKQDFVRCLNKQVRFFIREPIEAKVEHIGIITKVEDETVYVDIKGKIIAIPLSKITKAKQETEKG